MEEGELERPVTATSAKEAHVRRRETVLTWFTRGGNCTHTALDVAIGRASRAAFSHAPSLISPYKRAVDIPPHCMQL